MTNLYPTSRRDRLKRRTRFFVIAWVLTLPLLVSAADESPFAAWKNGPSADPSYFPVGVWLQSPANAERYRAAGINLFIGLWRGPTDEQLAQLKRAGVRVFCEQNAAALARKDDPTIAGWLLPDEPDNAQEQKDPKTGKTGYGPPVRPEEVVRWYEKARDADPTRPVLLNLGQGVGYDQWHGRGSEGKPEDYLTYVRGGDIVGFDVYPAASGYGPAGHNDLWLVGQGVRRLGQWTGGRKLVWNCLECTAIGGPPNKPTPKQVRSEAWLGLVHGSRGIVWFCHQFAPKFNEHALLDDPEMLAAVAAINGEIRELAPVLNSPNADVPATATSSDAAAPLAAMTKRHGGATYVFAVGTRDKAVRGTFTVPGVPAGAAVEVIGENRKVDVTGGKFEDEFEPYGVHLYRIR